MTTEIDALEFLSILALEELVSDRQELTWNFPELCKTAHRIEQQDSSIRITLDGYDIESFRLRSEEHIMIGLQDIQIKGMSLEHVQSAFKPCVPSPELCEIIKKALKR